MPGPRSVNQVPLCPPLDSTAAWALANREWSQEAGQSWSNDSLRRELIGLRDQDQGKPQRFGTQFNARPDGIFRMQVTSDLPGLASRRDDYNDRARRIAIT